MLTGQSTHSRVRIALTGSPGLPGSPARRTPIVGSEVMLPLAIGKERSREHTGSDSVLGNGAAGAAPFKHPRVLRVRQCVVGDVNAAATVEDKDMGHLMYIAHACDGGPTVPSQRCKYSCGVFARRSNASILSQVH